MRQLSEVAKVVNTSTVKIWEMPDDFLKFESACKRPRLVDSERHSDNSPSFSPMSLRVLDYQDGVPNKKAKVVFANVTVKVESDSEVEFISEKRPDGPRLIPEQNQYAKPKVAPVSCPFVKARPDRVPAKASTASSSTDVASAAGDNK